MYYWRTSNGAETDLLLEKHGKIVAAIEIKSTSQVSGADCSGLRSFREEYPATPLFVACTAQNSYDLKGVSVMPWQEMSSEIDQLL